MGGSSSNDSVGGSSSSGSSQSTSNSSNSDKGESFSNAMSNAERPDRAPASSTNDSGSNDTGGGSRSPNDDGGGRSMSNAERPDRAPASSSSGSGSDDTGGGSRSPNDDGGGPSLSNDERPDRAPATPSSGAGTNDPNDRPASPNDNGGGQSERAAGPPGIAAPPSGTTPTDTNPTDTNQGGGQENERGFFEGLSNVFTAPPTDASGNPRSTSPVSDRLNNTQSYSFSEVFGFPAKSPREAAIEMANAEFGVSMEVMRRDMNLAIDKKVGEYDQQIADLDQRLTEINEQLSPRTPNGIGGLGTIGFAPLEDARALMAEGRTLTEQREALVDKRADIEKARNLPDALDMGHISRDVYEVDSKLTNSHISRLSDQELQELGFETSLLENEGTGFRAEVYRNSITGEAVLAFQGTNFESVEDWKNNLQQGVGLTSPQYEQARRAADEFNNVFANEERSLTGHSLGGGMASYAALATGLEATTFNAAGLHTNSLDRVGATRNDALDLVTAHHVNGEAVSWGQDSAVADLVAAGLLGGGYAASSDFDPVPEAVGTRYGYEAIGTNGLPPDYQGGLRSDLGQRVDLHLMESVLHTLRHEKQRIDSETRLP